MTIDEKNLWPSDRSGAVTDWLEYVLPPQEDDEYPTRYRVNVSFLLSRWHCIFGQGCPGVLITKASYDSGCCQIGVNIGKEEIHRINAAVDKLTKEDADFIVDIQAGKWVKDGDKEDPDARYHTTIRDGACIFHNRDGGPSGVSGCALHAMAVRTGQSYMDTKPDICWQIPLGVTEESDDGLRTVTVDATPGRTWHSPRTDSLGAPGWWCTETPDAYNGDEFVLYAMKDELIRLLGEVPYQKMADRIEAILPDAPRYPMPGEVANKGRPMIPLMVLNRVGEWEQRNQQTKIDKSLIVIKDVASP